MVTRWGFFVWSCPHESARGLLSQYNSPPNAIETYGIIYPECNPYKRSLDASESLFTTCFNKLSELVIHFSTE